MFSIKTLVAVIIIPIMIGGAILMGLQEMKTSSLDPARQDAQVDIDKNARNMPIGIDGQGEELTKQDSKEQFRELVIYSQISAVNCQLLYWMHAEDSDSERASHYVGGSGTPGKIENSGRYMLKYTLPGRTHSDYNRLFNYMARSYYVPSCVGTSNEVHSRLVDKRTQAIRDASITDPVSMLNVGWQVGVGSIVGGAEDLWNAVDCKFEPDWAADRGNDMEGRFGAITFESAKTIFPGNHRFAPNSRIWGVNVIPEDRCDGYNPADAEFYGPDFFEGGDRMHYLPLPTDEETKQSVLTEEDYTETVEVDRRRGSGTRTVHRSISWDERVRELYDELPTSDALINAPAITDSNIDQQNGGSGHWPIEEVYYVICEGAQGKVKTNANTISNDGEAVWGEDNSAVGEYRGFETRTFTFINVNTNRTNCLDNIEYVDDVDRHGHLGSNSRSPDCSSFEDATQDPVKSEDWFDDEYECRLVKYDWEYEDGETLKPIYEIGWVKQ